MSNLTLSKWGFLEFRDFGAFPKAPAELHFKMQVIHIDDVAGSDMSRSDPNKR
jgi:hypothetical protein